MGCDIVRLICAAAEASPLLLLYLPRHQDLREVVALAHVLGAKRVRVERVVYTQPTPRTKLLLVYMRLRYPPPNPLWTARLAGPILRATFCQFYLGRYVIANVSARSRTAF